MPTVQIRNTQTGATFNANQAEWDSGTVYNQVVNGRNVWELAAPTTPTNTAPTQTAPLNSVTSSQMTNVVNNNSVAKAKTAENGRLLGPTEYKNLVNEWAKSGLTNQEIESNFLNRQGTKIYLRSNAPTTDSILRLRQNNATANTLQNPQNSAQNASNSNANQNQVSEQPKTVEQQIQDLITARFDTAAANDQYDIPEKSEAVNTLKGELDQLKNELDYNQVLQTAGVAKTKEEFYAGKENIENQVIPMGEINKQLGALTDRTNIALDKESIAAALTNATNTYRYNSKIIEYNVALGDLQNAQAMVKQSAQDFKDYQSAQLQLLEFQNQINQQDRELLQQDVDRQYQMALQGYTYIENPTALQQLAVKKGTDWVEQNTIKIAGKIYIKPQTVTEGNWKVETDASGNQFMFDATTGKVKQLGGIGDIGGQCGEYINNVYGTSVGDSWESKQAIANTDLAAFQSEPQVGDVVIFKTKMPYGHIAAVTAVNGDKITITESNWNNDEKIGTRTISVKDSSITGIYRGATKKQEEEYLVDEDGKPVKIEFNGKDYMVNKNGEPIEPKVPGETTSFEKAQKAEEIIALIESLENDKSLSNAVGPISSRLPTLRGGTADFETKFKTLISKVAIENLNLLKGPMSDKDIQFIKEQAAALNLSMSEKGFREGLETLKTKFENVKAKTTEQPNSEYPAGTIVEVDGKKYKSLGNNQFEEIK